MTNEEQNIEEESTEIDMFIPHVDHQKKDYGRGDQYDNIGEASLATIQTVSTKESEIYPHGKLLASVDVDGIGSYPTTREEKKQIPLQEQHNVVSHNIDFSAHMDKRNKDDDRNSKIKETAEEENVHQVFQQVARKADIYPKSM
ncbi:hypothetical protein K7X08_029819 [Anisodus acutangulus]|uniref:Uncharacterized protein n=1 Tax=Anisodus acutangulus TaxID=402998 RepID=A0A9Q1RH49_9SOLA|nr:hypothetical protein K7X08_029819 [Anisodus acutangulus]